MRQVTDEQIRKTLASGLSQRETAAWHGVTRWQVRRVAKAVQFKCAPKAPCKPRVTSTAPPAEPVASSWRKAEADTERRIKSARERSRFTVTLDDGRPMAISFISDQHIAPGTPVAFRRMREDAELIANTEGLYAILTGDGVDNHIKHRSAMLAARSQPGDQWRLYEHYLCSMAEKILVLISGNHDAWSDQFAGVDMVGQIAARNSLCYCPAEAYLTVRVGSIPYRIGFRHQYRSGSAMNPCHSVKQWYRNGEQLFDIGCIGHEHEPSIEAFEGHGHTRWACRPGSYQITSSYARQYGFNATKPSCPTFILFPKRREIIGFWDVRHAVKTLNAERNT